jgi:hypothetical protein
MRLDARLRKLEATYTPRPGCPRCRTRDGDPVVICDDADPPTCTRPRECAGCGRVVESGEVRIFGGLSLELL